ncbi:hypothetical protein P3L10_004369 [Capsicum annuum]
MEEKISILIQYGGEWNSEHNFNNFVVDGLTLKLNYNFETFLDELTKILGVYAPVDTVEIKFFVKYNYTPMKIFNDRSLKWYMNLKCKSSLTDYPLCITMKKKDCDLILSNINTITSRCNDLQLIGNGEHVESVIPNEGEHCDGMKIAKNDIINNIFHKEIKKGQLYYLVCKDDQCSWYLRSSCLNKSDIFKVRRFYNVHTYENESRFFAQRHATSEFVGGFITDKFDDPKSEYTPVEIQCDITNNYGVELNYMKACREKKALEILWGKPRDSYAKLLRYLYMVKHTNLG